VPVEGHLRTAEALRLTNTDWQVEKVSIVTAPEIVYILGEDDEPALDAEGAKIVDRGASENSDLFGVKNPHMCMTVREDTRSYLGTVGKNYRVIQNSEFASFFDAALGEDAAAITAVGSLGRFGARVFMIASLPEMLEIVPGDPIERHIMLTTTHDGSGPIEALFLAWGQENNVMLHAPGGRVRIRHTKNADKRITTAPQVLHQNEQYWGRIKRAFSYMAKRDAGEQRVRDFLEAMFPDIIERGEDGEEVDRRTSRQAQRARDDLQAIFEGDAGVAKTDWGLYNSVAIFVDHERRVARGQKNQGISRWEISVFGSGGELRDRAFRWLDKNR
jgi:phage/plasmid-like protein (TIGR03299 family)